MVWHSKTFYDTANNKLDRTLQKDIDRYTRKSPVAVIGNFDSIQMRAWLHSEVAAEVNLSNMRPHTLQSWMTELPYAHSSKIALFLNQNWKAETRDLKKVCDNLQNREQKSVLPYHDYIKDYVDKCIIILILTLSSF